MESPATTVERDGRSTVVHLRGDLVVPAAGELYATLRAAARRRDTARLVLDFAGAGRIDSSGVAVIALIRRQLAGSGKQLTLDALGEQHRAALALAPDTAAPAEPVQVPGVISGLIARFGERVIELGRSLAAFGALVADAARQAVVVAIRRGRMPAGALGHHIEAMGVDAIFIVGLLSFLTGMTMAFQGAVQLQRFGAGVFVADMVGVSMVRELVPLMTAVIVTGRTGAAIAAELGTMRVRSEIDALATMGIRPVRFLIVPRLLAISVIGPALTLIGIFVGVLGGMVVAAATLDMPPVTFWARVAERVTLSDFAHGLGKSVVFAWIIGLSASHLGMRASGDAGSVGSATTRTVVTSVFLIIVVDAVFATLSTFVRYG